MSTKIERAWFILLAAVVGGSAVFAAMVVVGGYMEANKYSHMTTLPPGYTLTCDAAGHYIAVMPHGTEIDDIGDRPFSSRSSAINRAWHQYYYEVKAEKKYNFKSEDCNE